MGTGPFYHIAPIYLVLPFLFLLVFFNWLGYRFRQVQIKQNPSLDSVSLGPTEGSLIGLTALILSFSFGMTASKFDARRQIIVEEANDIGTVILRCDLYPDSIGKNLRTDLRNYLETRIAYYDAGDDEKQIELTLQQTDSVSKLIWKRVAGASRTSVFLIASNQMIPALNAMIDIVTTREASRKAVVPRLILIILSILLFVSAFLSGYGSKDSERNRILVFAFAIMTSLALYLVVDLDRPRQGLINLASAEQHLLDLKSNF